MTFQNPALHNALEDACSRGLLRGKVEVQDAGAPAQPPDVYGETFKICCPFCQDERNRLYIPHRWGTLNPQTLKRYLTVKCFNEGCDDNFELIRYLEKIIDPLRSRCIGVQFASSTPHSLELSTDPPQSVPVPPCARPLTDLPAEHPSLQLLWSRGFDPDKLSDRWGVRWLEVGDSPSYHRRLIFPFTQGSQEGWQARYVDAAQDGAVGDVKGLYRCLDRSCARYTRVASRPGECPHCGHERVRGESKWHTPYGMKKSKMLYNHDHARQWPFVVICEGPLDVCRLGTPMSPDVPGPGVAAFGHSLGHFQHELIVNGWQAAVLLFDPELWANPREQEKVEKTHHQLNTRLPGGASLVRLADGLDPGDTYHETLWAYLLGASARQGVNLTETVTA